MSKKRSSKKKRSYEDVLSSLSDILSAREEDLEAREKKVQKDREELDKELFADYGDTGPSDVLHLNIGGTKTMVLRRTLTSVPGSMLASRFSGRWDDSIEKDENGCFFIDQEYSLFKHVLEYLRNKANGVGKYPMEPPDLKHEGGKDKTKDFYRMVDYYGLTNGIYPVALKPLRGDLIDGCYSKKAETNKWETYRIDPIGHDRRVKTYEVALGKVQRVQIGWASCNLQIDEDEIYGVGEKPGTFALDLTRSSFLVEGDAYPVDRLEQFEGTIVRSENYGKLWYVNGNLVTPVEKLEELSGKGMTPCITFKGEIEVTFIELEAQAKLYVQKQDYSNRSYPNAKRPTVNKKKSARRIRY